MKNSKWLYILVVSFAVFLLSFFFYSKKSPLEIFVVYYKPAPLIKTDIFKPIQGGRAIANTPSRYGKFTKEEKEWLNHNMIGDDTGDNISELNRYFAEISALYWISKNTDTPYVGMFHYRRFLNLNPNSYYPIVEFPSMRFYHLGINHLKGFSKEFLSELKLNKEHILSLLEKYDIIVSEPIQINVYENYKEAHVIQDLDRTLEIIKQKYPEMYDFALNEVHSDKGFIPCNMFITKREILNNYSQWLFSILFPLYDNIKEEVSQRDTEQKMAFAYLSERLFSIYIRYHQQNSNLKVKEYPHALASSFFNPPAGKPYLILKGENWEDTFLDEGNNRICGFNNPLYHCGKYEFTNDGHINIDWDNKKHSTFKHQNSNIFNIDRLKKTTIYR